jgi:WD40 repeat protein
MNKSVNKVKKQRTSIHFEDGNSISNDDNFFNKNEIGISREVILRCEKRHFINKYLSGIKEIYRLSDGDMAVLNVILTAPDFRGTINWNLTTRTRIAEKTLLTPESVRKIMVSLSRYKKLFIKTGRGKYKINRAVLCHSFDVKNSRLVQLIYTFEITDTKPNLSDFLKGHGEITEEVVDEFILASERIKQMYNKQQRDNEREQKEMEKRQAEQQLAQKEKTNPFA